MAVGGCYPGPCQMQYMASYSPDGGIWFGAEDFRHGTKTLEFGADDGDGTRIRLRIEQYCGQDGPPERYAPDYDIVLRPFEGDWTDAAAICRDQVRRDPSLKSIPPKPEWLDESPVAVILSIRGRGESFAGENAYSRCENAFPRLRELSEAFGSPVLALLMRWDRHGPWLPPWCWPPAGGTESLFRLRDLLHESGNRIGLYCSGTAFTVRSLMNGYTCRDEFERDGLNRRMACGPDGKTLWTMNGIREGTQLCITEEFGREIMLDQVRRIAEAGIDYLQFFDQNFGGICYPCYSKEHRHPPVPGRWQTEAMTRLIDDMNEQIRRTGSRMILGTESSASMPYLAGLPLNDSRRICQVIYGRPVPAYSFVYHRYAGSFLGNQCTVWQNVDCPACPDNLLYRLAEGFCAGELLAVTLRADGSIAWGAADDWSEPPPDNETAITLIRNLNKLRRKYRKFLLHGEMEKSPVRVAGLPAYRLPLRPRRQHAGGGKAFTELPPLPESCWSAPDGERIQFLVNFRPEPAASRASLHRTVPDRRQGIRAGRISCGAPAARRPDDPLPAERLTMKHSILLLLLTAAFRLAGNSPAPEIAWEFDPAFGVKEQGLELNGFDSMKVLPEGTLKLAANWKKDGGGEPYLRSSYEMFAPYDSRDLGVLEIRLRARVSPEIAGAGIGFRVRLRHHRGGGSEQQLPLEADGAFHIIRIDFSKFRHPENSRGFYLYLYPLVNTGGAEGWASVELDYLRVRFSDAGAVRNIRLVADEKIADMQELLQSFKPYGIVPKGADAGQKKLHALRGTLDSGAGPGQYEAAMELDREFVRQHSVLRFGRRLKELFDEAHMLESSIGRRNEKAVQKEETARFRAALERIGLLLSRGEFDAARTSLDAADRNRTALWNRLLSPENGGPAWQRGIDAYSTGLFGWQFRTRESLAFSVDRERLVRGFFVNRDGTKTGLSIRPEGAAFLKNDPEELETSWTSSNWNYPCRTADGQAGRLDDRGQPSRSRHTADRRDQIHPARGERRARLPAYPYPHSLP